MGRTVLSGGHLIDGRGDEIRSADVVFDASGVLAVDSRIEPEHGDAVIDVDGLLVAPGLIDLHGDAFERSLMPRAGVFSSMAIAMQDNQTQLAASGISTSYLSATDSWEPGLRSRETLRDLVAHLAEGAPGPELRLHVRHETTLTDGFDELAGWIRDGTVSMVSFADHTPGGISHGHSGPSPVQLQRSGVDLATYEQMTAEAVRRRDTGLSHDQALCWIAAEARCPTASHDGGSIDDVQRDAKLAVDVAEFPMSVEVASAYRDAGMRVLLGAPNLVRGGSHLGNLSVADALRIDLGDVLCSDYHYPSLLQAPFAAAAAGLCTLATAWKAASASAAEAAGLEDRGVLEPGRRADVVVLDDRGSAARVRELFVDGESVYRTV